MYWVQGHIKNIQANIFKWFSCFKHGNSKNIFLIGLFVLRFPIHSKNKNFVRDHPMYNLSSTPVVISEKKNLYFHCPIGYYINLCPARLICFWLSIGTKIYIFYKTIKKQSSQVNLQIVPWFQRNTFLYF